MKHYEFRAEMPLTVTSEGWILQRKLRRVALGYKISLCFDIGNFHCVDYLHVHPTFLQSSYLISPSVLFFSNNCNGGRHILKFQNIPLVATTLVLLLPYVTFIKKKNSCHIISIKNGADE